MSSVYGIILAGGVGSRFGGDRPKQLLSLGSRPLIAWTIEAFHKTDAVFGIIVVSTKTYCTDVRRIVEEYGFIKVVEVVEGGSTRQQSAYNALTYGHFNQDDILLLHDAARPFIRRDIITRCIDAAGRYGACGVYVPVVDTITQIDQGRVEAILNRERLYYTQTPQAFTYSVIRNAHENARSRGVDGATDDVSLVVSAGSTVHMVEGDYTNIKITSPHDCAIAEMMIQKGIVSIN